MNSNYKPKLTIESTDKYVKARDDVIQAANSLKELTPQQRKKLAEELFGNEVVTQMVNIMQQRF